MLDSASKKLLKKGILGKEIVNDSPKLTLSSLEAVVAWVHENGEMTRKSMERREQDLQSFVDSLSPTRAGPILNTSKKWMAWNRRIQNCSRDVTASCSTSSRTPYRGGRSTPGFPRPVLPRSPTHRDHHPRHRARYPLGRRYQSRDPFEYRQTLLVPESVYAFNTEKVIAGDWVGTINHADAKALIIRSPEMAHTERAMFEAIWKQEMAKQKEKGDAGVPVVVPKEEEMKTKMVSAARSFS